jgi:hypothetical protein
MIAALTDFHHHANLVIKRLEAFDEIIEHSYDQC